MRSSMAGRTTPEGPAPLLGVTIRRAFSVGRIYLVIGIFAAALWEVVLVLGSPTSFATTVPALIPVFGSLGALGSVLVYTNDRVKGVFEYLIAYGVSPRRIAANILEASMALVTLALAVDLTLGVGLYAATGNAVTAGTLGPLLLYSVPMAYATAAFGATIGMYWTSLSSPRAGMNSPLGLVPMICIGPPLAALVLAGVISSVPREIVLDIAVAAVAGIVVLLLSQMERLMPRERLLSPA